MIIIRLSTGNSEVNPTSTQTFSKLTPSNNKTQQSTAVSNLSIGGSTNTTVCKAKRLLTYCIIRVPFKEPFLLVSNGLGGKAEAP